MILERLKTYDAKTANSILASAALSDSHEEPDVEARELLSDIRRKLGISDEDVSVSARRQVDNFLSKMIASAVVGHANQEEVLSRAGQSGRLLPGLYKVAMPPGMKLFFDHLGVRPNHVEDAIRRPDDFQHLLSQRASGDKAAISLFLRKVISRDSTKSHWLLVQTHRVGVVQNVQSAWLVYPQDVDLSDAEKPLDVLKAFVAKYGMKFLLNGEWRTFLDWKDFSSGDLVRIELPTRGGIFWSWSSAVTTTLGVTEIGIGYCIDLFAYRQMLRSSGSVPNTLLGEDPFRVDHPSFKIGSNIVEFRVV